MLVHLVSIGEVRLSTLGRLDERSGGSWWAELIRF
jgi:hypothetical protein